MNDRKVADVAIIGCGLIGTKRALALQAMGRLAGVFDVQPERAAALAAKTKTCIFNSLEAVLQSPAVRSVIVATTHDQLVPLSVAVVEAGKHLLVEKPGARRGSELRLLADAAAKSTVTVRVGFNHRFHPALLEAKRRVEANAIGDLFFVRAHYGHGGRLGYESEWRANPTVGGGGELLDQGSHLLDLAGWFLGAPWKSIQGTLKTFFWKMPVEDNAFLTLQNGRGNIAHLHASWTEWKNRFSFEIVGRTGTLKIDGLGGSYGVEQLTHYRMRPEMGPPDITVDTYPEADASWSHEIAGFLEAVAGQPSAGAQLSETIHTLDAVEYIYRHGQTDGGNP